MCGCFASLCCPIFAGVSQLFRICLTRVGFIGEALAIYPHFTRVKVFLAKTWRKLSISPFKLIELTPYENAFLPKEAITRANERRYQMQRTLSLKHNQTRLRVILLALASFIFIFSGYGSKQWRTTGRKAF